MAKTYKYWVIVAGNTPTAFRAREQEPLIPTLKQLQRTQPDVTLSWFERDRLWTSPEQAEADFARRRGLHRERGATWRPGGTHKDPKARVELTRDQKRAKFKKQLGWKGKEADSLNPSEGSSKSAERPINGASAGAGPVAHKIDWRKKPTVSRSGRTSGSLNRTKGPK